MKNEKKPTIRVAFRDFLKGTLDTELGDLNDKQRSWALTKFYISEIHNRLRGHVSEEEFDEGYVDAGGDVGADFIRRDDNVVLILQLKYAKEGAVIDIKDVEHFQGIFHRLIDPGFKKNVKLADMLADVDFENDTFFLRFISFARLEGQAKEQTLREPDFPHAIPGLRDRVTFEWLDEGLLTEELRSVYAFASGIPKECELVSQGTRGKRGKVLELEGGEYRSCVLVVPAQQLVNLYQQYKDALFTLNIRNYIGSTATNKGIINASLSHPGEFYHYNNGISCLGTSVEVMGSGDRVKVMGLQVINGAQTVKALFRASQQKGWKVSEDQSLVLVRITEVSRGYGEEGRFANNVIRYNNTQNVIKASDFRSNDPVQNDLKEKFKKVVRFGRVADYMPKRSEPMRRNAWVIRMEEFAKVAYSFLVDPIAFSGSTSFLFDETEQGGYRHVFGNGKYVWDKMPEEEFRLRSAIWWMGEAFGERRKDDRAGATDPAVRGALE